MADRGTNSTANFYDVRPSIGRYSETNEAPIQYKSPSITNIQSDITKVPRSAHYTNVLSRAQHVLERSGMLGETSYSNKSIRGSDTQTSITPKGEHESDSSKRTFAVLDKANKILERSAALNKRLNNENEVNEETFAEQIDKPLETFGGKNSSEISNYNLGYSYKNVAQSAEKGSNPRDILSKINQVLQSSSKIISDHGSNTNESGAKQFGVRSLGHNTEPRERDFETPQRSHIYKTSGDPNKFTQTAKSLGTSEFETRIPESIQMAYDSVLKRSQELIFKTEDEFAKSVPRSQNTPRNGETDRHIKHSPITDRQSGLTLRSPVSKLDSRNRPIARLDMSPPGVQVSAQAIRPKFVEEYFDDGTIYRGEKVRTVRQGRGELIETDGTKYDGEWENDKKNGYGVLISQSGHTRYDGEWKDDLYHGNGIMVNPDPKEQFNFDFKNFDTVETHWIKYEGEFINGRMHGLGTLTLFNNERYVGKFKYNKIHGAGVFHRKNGDVISGEWEDNRYVHN